MRDQGARCDAAPAILVCAGCILLLLGNVLPWPCVSGYAALDCPVLITVDLGELAIGYVLAAALFLVPFVTMALRTPWSLIPWFSVWLLLYLLTGATLYSSLNHGFPLVRVNHDLAGPARYVMPPSFLAFWLALRPPPLRRRWRPAMFVTLVVLVCATSLFFLLSALATYPLALLDSSWTGMFHVGVGPLLILLGSGVLLWEEYAGLRRDRASVVPESTPSPKAAREAPVRVYTIGFWSAVLLCASLLVGVTAPQVLLEFFFDGVANTPREIALLSSLDAASPVVALLITVPFVALIACIHRCTPAEKRIWTQMALFFGVVYAALYLGNVVLHLTLFRSHSPLADWLLNSLPVINPRYGQIYTLSLALVCLAGLSMLPVLDRGGIETAIRWCFVIMALLVIAMYIPRPYGDDAAAWLRLGFAFAWAVLFPLSTALFAIVFRRPLQSLTRGEPNAKEIR